VESVVNYGYDIDWVEKVNKGKPALPHLFADEVGGLAWR
jgi:hypothetical protein